MKHLKRFDEGVFDVIKNIFKSPKWESGKLSDYLSDPNVDKSPVLDFLINYTLEKIKVIKLRKTILGYQRMWMIIFGI